MQATALPERMRERRSIRGSIGNLDVSFVWTLGREGEQARPGSGCGQRYGRNQGLEARLYTAPMVGQVLAAPTTTPVVDIGPGWRKSWKSRPLSALLSIPFFGGSLQSVDRNMRFSI